MPVPAAAERWFLQSKNGAQREPRLRLFCLPFAGGGASTYRSWLAEPPPGVEIVPVQIPGRENRLVEAPYTRVDALIRSLGHAVRPYVDRPYALFGHSMGALLSFELARYLARRGERGPERLFVSASRAPWIKRSDHAIHFLPDAAFIDAIRQLQGTPERVLQNAELMQLVMPVLRADFELVETYRYHEDQPLTCPVSVFGGMHDVAVSISDLAGWAELTCANFSLRMLPGNHFFLNDPTARAQLMRAIGRDLQQALEISA